MACLKCHKTSKTAAVQGFCSKCLAEIDLEARQQQERDYLIRYLSTREEDFSRGVVRLRLLARRDKIRLDRVPEPMIFAKRLEVLKQRYGWEAPNRGRKKKGAA